MNFTKSWSKPNLQKLPKGTAPLSVVALFAFLGMGGQCSVETQSPEKYATDGVSFGTLSNLANPQPTDLSALDVANGDKGTRVAVIDNGVDYMHPQLQQQVSFTLSENSQEIVGAGFDAMGHDQWAHPNLIDPSLFAFGARVEENKISEPLADPLSRIKEVNGIFSARLQEAIHANETLSQSLFRKLGPDSFSIFGAAILLQFQKFDPKTYQLLKEKDFLATEAKLNKPTDSGYLNQDDVRLSLSSWIQDPNTGSPKFYDFDILTDKIWSIEHADLFHDVLQSVYFSVSKETDFGTMLESYQKYRLGLVEKSEAESNYNEIKTIQKAFYKYQSNYSSLNPAADMKEKICLDGLPPALRAKYQQKDISDSQKAEFAQETFDLMFNLARDLNEAQINFSEFFENPMDAQKTGKKNQENFDAEKVRFQRFIERKGLENFSCSDIQNAFHDTQKFSDFGQRYQNPYLSSQNTSAHHGTHVAGIVAVQNPRNLIVPVRVTTQSVETSTDERQKLADGFLQEFAAWLKEPVVNEGVAALLTRVYGEGSDSEDSIVQFLEAIVPINRSQIESSPLEIIFINDVAQAIEWVGKQHIKVANVSLGTSFARAPVSPVEQNPEELISSIFKYLSYEFYKYKIAKSMKTHAAQTLFIIASGNDGNWVDGKSRSALPCDLSSPYFAAFEEPSRGVSLPNNAIDNVLCVGSINPEDELSSFSNLPITRVPFVLSYGEAILSTIRSGNCEGSDQYYMSTFAVSSDYTNVERNEKTAEIAKKYGFLRLDQDYDKENTSGTYEGLNAMSNLVTNFLSEIQSADSRSECVSGTRGLAKLSGTSMATPAVAGVVGRLIDAKRVAAGLSENEIWENPEYSPAAVIGLLKEQAPAYGGDSLVAAVKKVISTRQWPLDMTPRSLLASAQNSKEPLFLFQN